MQLRDYQVDAIHSIRGEYRQGHQRPVLCLPTGAGKTVIASEIIDRALDRGARRVVFLIDSLTLVEQTIKSFESHGKLVGVIQGLHYKADISKQIQIATPQTLKRRFQGRNADTFKHYMVDLIIVDECHVQHSGVREAAEHWRCPVLGLTATPYTKGMGKFYDSVIQPIKMDELIDLGYLSPYRVYSHNAPDMKGVKVQGGDYVAKQAAGKYDSKLIGDVVQTWLKHGQGRKTVGFASTVASAQAFSKMFQAHGIKSDFTSGYLDTEEAQQRLHEFENGDTQVLWNVQKLTKGWDMPSVSCMIDCAPTKSLSLHIQKGGRVLRTHDTKDYALILDNAGNFIRNGFLEDAEIDVLDNGSNEKDRASKERLPKLCPNCQAVKKGLICQMCGYETKPISKVESEEGELSELSKTQRKHNKDSKEVKREFFGGLKQYAQDKGYKPGWAANKYRQRYGVWPNKYRDTEPVPPNEMVRGFITHENIRYAKRRTA